MNWNVLLARNRSSERTATAFIRSIATVAIGQLVNRSIWVTVVFGKRYTVYQSAEAEQHLAGEFFILAESLA